MKILLKYSILITTVLVIAISCIVLLGWTIDVSMLKGSISQIPSISPIEAMFFILTAVSINLLKAQTSQNWQYKVGQVCGLLVALLSAILLLKYFLMTSETQGTDPITFWFNNNSQDNVKMSPFVAVSILLIGIGILLIDYITPNGRYLTQWLILGAFLIEIFAISISSYGVLLFDGSFNFVIKPHAGFIILLLCYSTIAIRRHSIISVTLFDDDGPGSKMLRMLLPIIILGPIVLGWFKVWGQNAGLFSAAFGDVILALTGSSMLVALFWNAAHKLQALNIHWTETEALLKNTLKTAPDSIILCNDAHEILLANEQTEQMFGYLPNELLNQKVEVLVPENLRGAHAVHQQNYINQPQLRPMGRGIDIMGRRKDGSLFPVDIALSPQLFHGHRIYTAIVRDITDRRLNEESLIRQKRALSMISRGNRILLHSLKGDEKELLQAMCQVIIDVGGFKMAWVGYKVDDSEKNVLPMARAGFNEGYIEKLKFSWGEGEQGLGPVGYAIRTGQIQVAKNFSADTNFGPWRQEAKIRGYRSGIALPLKKDDEVFGVLMVYSAESDTFDELEIFNLDEMAADLSFGITTLRNNLAHAKAENDLKRSHSMLESTLESTADGIVVTTLTGEILKYNRQFLDIWGIENAKIVLNSCNQLVSLVSNQLVNKDSFIERTDKMFAEPAKIFQDEFKLQGGRTIQRIGRPYYMGSKVVGRACSLRDVTEQKKHESQLTYLANHDALTGLPNRNLLNHQLTQIISRASRSNKQFALLFLDLDQFKLINDGLGHDFGDQVLVKIAERIQACLKGKDTIARMGGDEFVVLLPNTKGDEDIATTALNLLESIALPCTIDSREFLFEASIGIAVYPRDGADAFTLLKRADAAMYRAKDENGGNAFKFYEDGIDAQVNRHLEIALHIQNAIDQNEFEVVYQPQFDSLTEKIVGAEALIRWKHPTMGAISPAEFIPIAEKSSMILKIGEWVAETVIKQCKTWHSNGIFLPSVAINISARQIEHSDLATKLASLLNKYNLNTDAFTLELELTEGMLIKQPEYIIPILNELKAMNFNISIDDFGTGYSSLAYLKKFPIDKLKIDRSFIKDIPDDPEDVAISSAIIVMSHELGMKVVAEGVETKEQFDFLKKRGCDLIQGYLTGRPMSADDFESLLNSIQRKL